MSFSAAYKGKDGKIYYYQGTSDTGQFIKKGRPTDKLADYMSGKKDRGVLTINELNKKVPVYSRDSLMKGYPEYVERTEGYKYSIFDPKQKGWEAEDFKGKKFILKYQGKRLIKRPLTRIAKRRRDGIRQRYWRR